MLYVAIRYDKSQRAPCRLLLRGVNMKAVPSRMTAKNCLRASYTRHGTAVTARHKARNEQRRTRQTPRYARYEITPLLLLRLLLSHAKRTRANGKCAKRYARYGLCVRAFARRCLLRMCRAALREREKARAAAAWRARARHYSARACAKPARENIRSARGGAKKNARACGGGRCVRRAVATMLRPSSAAQRVYAPGARNTMLRHARRAAHASARVHALQAMRGVTRQRGGVARHSAHARAMS